MKIGNVKIDLQFYKGEDLYSDGDIEEEILSIVKENSEFIEVLAREDRWPILYHLTPKRRNLLDWFGFEKNANLLEIGAGCGALTGLFCEKVSKVVAVELSKRRAEIIAHRHKEKSNLEIIIGNLNDITFNEKFDYITLIGVLEYAGKFTEKENPFQQFLVDIRKHLKPGGTLILAIENKFGLKYWSGAREDHTGRFFESLENYLDDCGVRTFSKDELTQLLLSSGFSDTSFYYPLPDYKIPLQVFSDEYLPGIGHINGYFPNFDQDRICFFSERNVYRELIKNNKFDFFANSFLVFCKEGMGHDSRI